MPLPLEEIKKMIMTSIPDAGPVSDSQLRPPPPFPPRPRRSDKLKKAGRQLLEI